MFSPDFGENVYRKKVNKFEIERKTAVAEAVHETQRKADKRLKKVRQVTE